MKYTYYLSWTDQDLHYYGARFAKDANPQDLWQTYFTSSKYVEAARKKYGEPDVIQVRKLFESAEDAIQGG